MGAVFGAAANATFTFIIFAFEITRDYNAVLPLMFVCVIASGIARRFMKASIMTEKLARRGLRVHQEYERRLSTGDRWRNHGQASAHGVLRDDGGRVGGPDCAVQVTSRRRQAALVLDRTKGWWESSREETYFDC